MALITDLLQQQAQLYPATLNEEEAEKNRGDFDKLLAAEIVKQAATPLRRICPTCSSEAVEVHAVSGTRAYTLCTIDEEAGRDYFDPTSLKQWVFDTTQLIKLFQKAIGIGRPQATEVVPGLLWDLGAQSVNGAGYQLFFCRNPNELDDEAIETIATTQHPALFHTGPSRQTLPPHILKVPLQNCIKEVQEDGIHINTDILEQHFPFNKYLTSTSGPAQKIKYNVSLRFPEAVQWEKVTLRVKDNLQEVDILYEDKLIKTADFEWLGFYQGTKEKKPDRQWQFLMLLATAYSSDFKQAIPKTIAASINSRGSGRVSVDTVHKRKERLADALKIIFQTQDDPFPEQNYYQPAFKLLPPPEFRKEPWAIGGPIKETRRL